MQHWQNYCQDKLLASAIPDAEADLSGCQTSTKNGPFSEAFLLCTFSSYFTTFLLFLFLCLCFMPSCLCNYIPDQGKKLQFKIKTKMDAMMGFFWCDLHRMPSCMTHMNRAITALFWALHFPKRRYEWKISLWLYKFWLFWYIEAAPEEQIFQFSACQKGSFLPLLHKKKEVLNFNHGTDKTKWHFKR